MRRGSTLDIGGEDAKVVQIVRGSAMKIETGQSCRGLICSSVNCEDEKTKLSATRSGNMITSTHTKVIF